MSMTLDSRTGWQALSVSGAPRVLRASVTRSRLLERLDAAFQTAQLLLVGAPAGWGKTQLVAEWVGLRSRDGGLSVTWIDADSIRPSVAAFWNALCGVDSFDGATPGFDGLSQDQRRVVLYRTIRELGTDALFVIDEADGLGDSDLVLADLAWLLARIPQLRVWLIGRSIAELETSSLTTKLDSSVFPASELLLSPSETAEAARAMGAELSETDAAFLTQLVRGWPALTRTVLTRFRAEVGNDRTGDVQAVLRRCTIAAVDMELAELFADSAELRAMEKLVLAPFLTEDLIVRIAGASLSSLLERLERAGLAAREYVGDQQRFVVAELLREHLITRGGLPPQDTAVARREIAAFLEEAGEPFEAFRQYEELDDWAGITRMVGTHFPWFAYAHRHEIRDSLARLGRARVIAVPEIATVHALVDYWIDGLTLSGVTLLRELVHGVRKHSTGLDAVERVWAETLTVGGQRLLGNLGLSEAAIPRLTSAIDALPAERRDEQLALLSFARTTIGQTYLFAGRGRQALPFFAQAATDAADLADASLLFYARGFAALTFALDGDVNESRRLTDECVSAPQWSRLATSQWARQAQLAIAITALDAFDLDRARLALDVLEAKQADFSDRPLIEVVAAELSLLSAEAFDGLTRLDAFSAQSAGRFSGSFHRSLLTSVRAKLLLALGQPQEANATLNAFVGGRDRTAAALGRQLLVSGRENQAIALAESWTWREDLPSRTRIELLLVRAVAALRGNDLDAAGSAWTRALALYRQCGAGLPFGFVSDAMVREFTTLTGESLPDGLQAIPNVNAASEAVVPRLTKRETLVLQRLAASPSMGEIASALVVSPNTVKSQVRSIYRKLGASTRNEALTIAASWGLLRTPAREPGSR